MTSLSLHQERNSLYTPNPSSQRHPTQKLHQFPQIVRTECRSPFGHNYKSIGWENVGPSGWQRDQPLSFVVEVNSILAPGLLVGQQFKFASVPGMMRMNDTESLSFEVTLWRS